MDNRAYIPVGNPTNDQLLELGRAFRGLLHHGLTLPDPDDFHCVDPKGSIVADLLGKQLISR